MSRKTISIISNITFAITIILGGYVLISGYLARRNLMPGACPIEDNRTLLYIAIGFAVVTFILSFFDVKKPKDKDNRVTQAQNQDLDEKEEEE
jgi:phosphotransferase system  glucose/maltose/N-acetylglucosamine-specific IIC component